MNDGLADGNSSSHPAALSFPLCSYLVRLRFGMTERLSNFAEGPDLPER